MTYSRDSNVEMRLRCVRHTPLGVPVDPDVYITIATLSRSSDLSIRSSSLSSLFSPSSKSSFEVHTLSEVYFESCCLCLSTSTLKIACLIGDASPSDSSKVQKVLTCLSVPSTNTAEH